MPLNIKRGLERIPGGLMVVPLMLGALLNTCDQAHLGPVQSILKSLGATPDASGFYEFLAIGGFTEALFKKGALTLIGLFLFCIGAQMDLEVGGRALKKGVIITFSKYATGLAVGYLWGVLSDPMHGLLGLSTMAIVAAMTNSNGGMFAALTGQYGNASDVGSLAVLSLNDGPFLTLVGLGLMGAKFPLIAFLSVLIPVALGMTLGNLDHEIRTFLKPGESLLIPFFAFALGTGMDFGTFLNPAVVGAGLVLGVMTTVLTGAAGVALLRAFGERSQIAGMAEASTAGNAVATPAAVAAAASVAAANGLMTQQQADLYTAIAGTATAQVSISTLSTAVLCPLAVILWNKVQTGRGIDGRDEHPGRAP